MNQLCQMIPTDLHEEIAPQIQKMNFWRLLFINLNIFYNNEIMSNSEAGVLSYQQLSDKILMEQKLRRYKTTGLLGWYCMSLSMSKKSIEKNSDQQVRNFYYFIFLDSQSEYQVKKNVFPENNFLLSKNTPHYENILIRYCWITIYNFSL